jgi:hypothetical protein
MPWICGSLEYLEFKGETVKWINSRLGDDQLGPSDHTIGVILCLANWEVSQLEKSDSHRIKYSVCHVCSSKSDIE